MQIRCQKGAGTKMHKWLVWSSTGHLHIRDFLHYRKIKRCVSSFNDNNRIEYCFLYKHMFYETLIFE